MLARYEVNVAFVQKVKNKLIEKMRRKENSSFELSLSLAKQLAETAVNYADKIGVAITFSLVDIHGHLVLVHRMKNSLLASIDISQNKAFSAVALKMPTHQIGEQAQPGQELYGINQTNQQRIIPFGGGYPLKVNGRMIGGIGVSGGTVSEDMAIAEKVIETFERCLEVSRNEFRIE